MSFFPRTPSASISTNLLAITAALSMGLVGCSEVEHIADTDLDMGEESEERVLLKGGVQNQLFGSLNPETPSLSGLALETGIESGDLTSGTIDGQSSNTASSETASNEIYDEGGNEDDDDNAARNLEEHCGNSDKESFLALEVSAPAAVSLDEDITDSIKIALYNEGRTDAHKVALSVRLSSDKYLDDGDLEISEGGLVVSGPEAFSEAMIEAGKLQPLVGIGSGDMVLIVHAQQLDPSSGCIIDDQVASLPLEII
jgi:hypothetical protein